MKCRTLWLFRPFFPKNHGESVAVKATKTELLHFING